MKLNDYTVLEMLVTHLRNIHHHMYFSKQ